MALKFRCFIFLQKESFHKLEASFYVLYTLY